MPALSWQKVDSIPLGTRWRVVSRVYLVCNFLSIQQQAVFLVLLHSWGPPPVEYKAQSRMSIVECYHKKRSTQIGMQDVMCLILNKLIRFEPHTSVWTFLENSGRTSLSLSPSTIYKEKYTWLTRISLYDYRLLFMTTYGVRQLCHSCLWVLNAST